MPHSEILIVEDEPADATLLRRVFTKINSGLEVQVVSDGPEALEVIGLSDKQKVPVEHYPKCILLDLKLRALDGLDVLHAVKKDEKTRPIPVIVLTSSSDPEDVRRAYGLGANSYLIKPVRAADLKVMASVIYDYWVTLNHRLGVDSAS